MAVTMILKQGISLWLLMVALLAGCAGMPPPTPSPPPPAPAPTPSPPPAPAEVPPTIEPSEVERGIEVEAEGLTCHYLRQSFWAEEEFSAHLANQAQFKADFKEDFEQRLARNGVSASNYSFSFDSTTRSILIQCDIHSAISKSGNRYTARFEWLELPTGFDLLNFDKISKDTLKTETEIDGTAITLTLLFPAPTGNCHWHVWWTD